MHMHARCMHAPMHAPRRTHLLHEHADDALDAVADEVAAKLGRLLLGADQLGARQPAQVARLGLDHDGQRADAARLALVWWMGWQEVCYYVRGGNIEARRRRAIATASQLQVKRESLLQRSVGCAPLRDAPRAAGAVALEAEVDGQRRLVGHALLCCVVVRLK